jgi:hypothetical protein
MIKVLLASLLIIFVSAGGSLFVFSGKCDPDNFNKAITNKLVRI